MTTAWQQRGSGMATAWCWCWLVLTSLSLFVRSAAKGCANACLLPQLLNTEDRWQTWMGTRLTTTMIAICSAFRRFGESQACLVHQCECHIPSARLGPSLDRRLTVKAANQFRARPRGELAAEEPRSYNRWRVVESCSCSSIIMIAICRSNYWPAAAGCVACSRSVDGPVAVIRNVISVYRLPKESCDACVL